MRILIDGVTFQNVYQIGVQRYFRELLQRVGTAHEVDLLMQKPARSRLPENCRVIEAADRNVKYDLFQSTRFTLSPLPGVPQVLTIHDMIPELHWKYQSPEVIAEIQDRRLAADAAERIICISQATARDVQQVYPHLQGRLRVVYHGAEHLLAAQTPEAPPRRFHQPVWRRFVHGMQSRLARRDLAELPYVIFVGDRANYKNFQLVLDAMRDPQWDSKLLLAVAGARWNKSERRLLRGLKLHHRIKSVGRVSDSVLRDLYRSAVCFIYPSLAEGFGFPLLEAQLIGTPLVCSDIPVFHEIAGESAIYVDGHDPAALAQVVQRVARDGVVAGSIDAGRRNAGRFKWDQCAADTLTVYHEAAAS